MDTNRDLLLEEVLLRTEQNRQQLGQLMWELVDWASEWPEPTYDTPASPSPCRHSHSPDVAHKRATQTTQPAHATSHKPPQPHAATPTAEEGASTTPGHVYRRPNGLSAPPTRATAALRKRRLTTQRRRSGVKVRRLPPHPRGARPLLADPLRSGNASRCAEARDAEDVEQPGCDPPTATTTGRRDDDGDRRPPVAPPPLSCPPGRKAQALRISARRRSPHSQRLRATTQRDGSGAKRTPRVAQKRATLTPWSDQAATRRRPRRDNATTATTSGGHQSQSPSPPSTGPKGPGAALRRSTPTDRCPHATTDHRPRRRATTTATPIGGHPGHSPTPPSTEPKGSGTAHTHATSIAYHRCVATHQ